MIRPLETADLVAVAALWLAANLQAHAFIPAQYWREHYHPVRGLLAQAEVYVYEVSGVLQGFIGLDGDYIPGLFVQPGAQSRGIGKALLDFAKAGRPSLSLQVYQNNTGALRFYQREGFVIQDAGVDQDTGGRGLHHVQDCLTHLPQDLRQQGHERLPAGGRR